MPSKSIDSVHPDDLDLREHVQVAHGGGTLTGKEARWLSHSGTEHAMTSRGRRANPGARLSTKPEAVNTCEGGEVLHTHTYTHAHTDKA